MHQALSKSAHFYGSKTKELNFFNKPVFFDGTDAYRENFPDRRGVKYYFESTPHYFRALKGDVDVAQRVAQTIPDVRVIVVLRDPVERYESAYIHNMMRGRIPFEPTINTFTKEFGLVRLGRYATNLAHWRQHFDDIGVFFYDDLRRDPLGFVASIMEHLDVPCDLTAKDLEFRRNDKSAKIKRAGWPEMPVMSDELRAELRVFFADEVEQLESMVGRDLSHWR